MVYRYLILGAGRQGVAAAYDLARHGAADALVLADVTPSVAEGAAARLNVLLGRAVARPLTLDATDGEAVRRALEGIDGVLSCVPYACNLELTRAAIAAGAHMVDLGGHTGVVRAQQALDPVACRAGCTVVPDCGMGPGMNITLALAAMDMLDEPREVRIYDGGLPVPPKPPWGYALLFHVGGLLNEYEGHAYFLREGQVTEVPALAELETLDFPPLGRLEAFVTSGGLSTMPWTYRARLDTLENKTLRYPGHCEAFRAFRDLGLFSASPLPIDNGAVIPRRILETLLEAHLTDPEVRDVALIHVRARGRREGQPAEARVQLLDTFDEKTGFTAMERLTGWHASLVLGEAVRGEIPAGVVPVERALPGARFLAAAPARGWHIEQWLQEPWRA